MWSSDYVKVVGYTYACDIYCPDCVIKHMGDVKFEGRTEDVLDAVAESRGIDRTDSYSFDSEDFPKEILSYQAHTSCSHDNGCLDVCGSCCEPLDGVACYGFNDEPVEIGCSYNLDNALYE
jgi:hypothetical protein